MSAEVDIAMTGPDGQPAAHELVSIVTPVTKATVTVEHDNGVIVEMVFDAQKLGPLITSWTQGRREPNGPRDWSIHIEQKP